MGPPGAPFRLGPGAKCPSCPPVGGPAFMLQYTYITCLQNSQVVQYICEQIHILHIKSLLVEGDLQDDQ